MMRTFTWRVMAGAAVTGVVAGVVIGVAGTATASPTGPYRDAQRCDRDRMETFGLGALTNTFPDADPMRPCWRANDGFWYFGIPDCDWPGTPAGMPCSSGMLGLGSAARHVVLPRQH